MNDQTADETVISRVLSGDLDAYATLIERHKNFVAMRIFWRVPRSVVEELVQETFIEAYRALHTFKGESSFRSWLATIAARRIFRYWKQKNHGDISTTSLCSESADYIDTASKDASLEAFNAHERQREARMILAEALKVLSHTDRMVICLVFFEGCSIKEVAQELGMSQVNVKVRSYRAKKQLKHFLLSRDLKGMDTL